MNQNYSSKATMISCASFRLVRHCLFPLSLDTFTPKPLAEGILWHFIHHWIFPNADFWIISLKFLIYKITFIPYHWLLRPINQFLRQQPGCLFLAKPLVTIMKKVTLFVFYDCQTSIFLNFVSTYKYCSTGLGVFNN